MRGARLIEFKNEEQYKRALVVQNVTLGNELLSMMPVRARWTSEDVFGYMVKQLKIENESRLLMEGATSSTSVGRTPIGGKGWHRVMRIMDSKPSTPSTCWTCRAAGRPHYHFWRTCKCRPGESPKKGSPNDAKRVSENLRMVSGKGGKGKGGKGKGGRGGSQ